MITVSEIATRLADKCLALCFILLPGGREVKGEYQCGSINGGEGDSLKVQIVGEHRGHWKDWANPEHHGDLLDLWRLVRNLTPGEAIQQAKEYLGIRDGATATAKKNWKQPPKKETPLPSPGGRAFTWLTQTRKLTPETIADFKISIESSPKGNSIIFPCYGPSGKLLNRSYRSEPKDGEKKKVWQDEGCPPCLFGWHALKPEAYATRSVILTEGQIDTCTFAQLGFPALSIPNGTSLTWIEWEWENLEPFEVIYIAFDMDGAGRENAEKVIQRLGKHRCLIISMPHKDANEALQAGATVRDFHKWIADAKHPNLEGLISAAALESRVMAEITPKPKAFTLPFFDRKWPYDGLYFRPGEVTVWTGPYGNGKSSFLGTVALNLLASKIPVMIASMEVKPEITLRKMVTTFYVTAGYYFTGSAFRGEENEYPLEKGFQIWLKTHGHNLTFADVVGYISQEKLLEMMMFSFRKFGSRHFIIDSMMRIEGLEEDYPAQGSFMNALQAFVKETDAHIHLVVHPRKGMIGGRPTGTDIKGSSLIPNNADNIISVVRNAEKAALMKEWEVLNDEQEKMHDTEVTVDKQRETGWIGSFYFKFDRKDVQFTPCNKYIPSTPEKKKKPHYNDRY